MLAVAGEVVSVDQWGRNWATQNELVAIMGRYRSSGKLLGMHSAGDARQYRHLDKQWGNAKRREAARRKAVLGAEKQSKRESAAVRSAAGAQKRLVILAGRARQQEERGEVKGLLTLARQARHGAGQELHRVGRVLAGLRAAALGAPPLGPSVAKLRRHICTSDLDVFVAR